MGPQCFIIDVEYEENEQKMRLDMADDAVEMLDCRWCKNVKPLCGDSTLGDRAYM